jgi:O-antigen ligase/tetratricopeptide (TPR) repeat protein
MGSRKHALSPARSLETTLAKRRLSNHGNGEHPVTPIQATVGWIGRGACLVSVTGWAWVRGGVDYWAQVGLGGFLLVALVAWWVERCLDRSGTERGLPLVTLPVLLGIGLGWVQMIPMSADVAGWLAPQQAKLIQEFAAPTGMMDEPPAPAARIAVDFGSCRHQVGLLTFGLAALVLGAHFFRTSSHVISFLTVVAVNSACVAIAGLLQRIPISGRTLLSNELISGVLPFGSYVNRNNAAGYMLMGLAAAMGLMYWNLFGEQTNRRPKQIISKEIPFWRQVRQRVGIFVAEMTLARLACVLLNAVIILGILGTLSRGGVLALLIGGLLTAMTYGISRDSEKRVGWAFLTFLAVIGLSLWLGVGTRLARRFDELNNPAAVAESSRIRNWADTLPAVWEFGALGSGLGSYHAVHRLYRQDAEIRMFEHADNQYFQTLVEGGWLGLALLVAAIGVVVSSGVFVSQRGNSPRSLAIGVAGTFVITSLGVASLFDFGVQIPQNAVLLAMFVGLTAHHAHSLATRIKKKHWLRRDLPRWMTWVVAAGCVAGVLSATWHLVALAKLERLGAREALRADFLSLPDDAAAAQIGELEPLLAATPTYWGYRRLGELYVHRYRLARHAEIKEQLPGSPGLLWESTNLVNLYEQMSRLKRMGDRRLIESYAAAPEAEQFVRPAWRALIASRNLLPLQADVQLMLGQVQSVFGTDAHSLICLDRAYRTAPTNPDFAYIIGLMHMYGGRVEEATEYWQRCIALRPDPYFSRVLDRIHALPSDRWRIEPEVVMQEVVPRDPALLYTFCAQHLTGEKLQALRQACLSQADALLGDQRASTDAQAVALAIKIKLGLGDRAAALEQMKWLVKLAPSNVRIEDVRFDMANLMYEMEMFAEAYEQIKWLRKNDLPNGRRYLGLYEKLRQLLAIKADEM